MDFDFSPEQHIWWDTLERFLKRHVPVEHVRRCDAERRYPAESWDLVAREGWLGLLLPEEMGGAAAGAVMSPSSPR